MTRREKIEVMLAEDPADTFLRYSLAMELDKEGNHDGSLARFAELMRDAPPRSVEFEPEASGPLPLPKLSSVVLVALSRYPEYPLNKFCQLAAKRFKSKPPASATDASKPKV